MSRRFLRGLAALELEEKILNGGAIFAIIGIFFPWIDGEWLSGTATTYSGFGFYTAFMGISIFLLHLFLLLITVIPLTGGPVIVRRRNREIVRVAASALVTILVLEALSVLTKVTADFTRMEVRFGVYITLIGSFVTLLYAYLRLLEQRKSQVQELFHHPEDPSIVNERKESNMPPPPPPPPPPPAEPEDHRLYP
ncbi:MAG: hypothetical protein Q7R81_07285 [Candidatus Peregrinibacteria bacterium]|nr:hypothetical protein [Candidatus Peregrinibacteria bacterium]